MSRYFDTTNQEKLTNEYGWSTSAPSTYTGKPAGLGSYDRRGSKGHPLNDQRGEPGRESESRPIEETTAAYKPAGREGRGYPNNGAHTVKAAPLPPKQRAQFQS